MEIKTGLMAEEEGSPPAPARIVLMYPGSLSETAKYTIECLSRSWIKDGKKVRSRNVLQREVKDPNRLELCKRQLALPWGALGHTITPLRDGWADLCVEVDGVYTAESLAEMAENRSLIQPEEWDDWWKGLPGHP